MAELPVRPRISRGRRVGNLRGKIMFTAGLLFALF